MARKVLTDLDLNQNELQNAVVQNLAAAPASPKPGQEYFNTTDKEKYIWNGTSWVKETSQGKIYTFSTGLTETTGTVTLNQATSSALGGVIVGGNISVSSGTISVADASTSGKGVIEIATDTEASTGTDTTRAINAKQLATKVTANTAITGATKCKITYDSKGLVTAGADLQASDIPDLTTTKINALTDYTKGSTGGALAPADTLNQALSKLENQIDAKVTANSAITAGTGTVVTYDTKGLVTSSSDIGIDSASANYLSFNTSTYKIGAKVDTTVGTVSTNLVTSGAVKTYVDDKISAAYKAKGSIDFADRPTPGSSYEGFVYNINDAFTTDSTFVEGSGNTYPAGTNIVCINTTGTTYKWDVIGGFVDTSTFLTASSTATLTNKTFDANGTGNSISNIETGDFATGVLQTTVRAKASASDTALASEKAIATALEDKQNAISAGTANDIVAYSGTKGSVGTLTRTTSVRAAGSASDTYIPTEKAVATALSGKQSNVSAGTANNIVAYSGTEGTFGTLTRTTSVRASGSASDTYIPTEKAVATAVEAKCSKATFDNSALTASSGICTWTISTTLAPDCICSVREKTSGAEVYCDLTYGSGSITVKINSASNISANTYTAVVIG